MFESFVDTEHPFGHASTMHRTRVRRRRIGAVAVLVLTAALGAPAAASAFGEPSTDAPSQRYVVRAGDTLWSVATHLAPQEDPRDVVDRLVEVNALDGATIVPGQVLVLNVG